MLDLLLNQLNWILFVQILLLVFFFFLFLLLVQRVDPDSLIKTSATMDYRYYGEKRWKLLLLLNSRQVNDGDFMT